DMKILHSEGFWSHKIVEGSFNDADPEIPGMKLVARNGELCYFRLDPDDKITYQRMDEPISKMKIMELAALFEKLEMSELAERMRARKIVSVSQLVDLTHYYLVPEAIHEKGVLQLKGPEDLIDMHLVDGQGKLHGNKVLLEYFMRSLLAI